MSEVQRSGFNEHWVGRVQGSPAAPGLGTTARRETRLCALVSFLLCNVSCLHQRIAIRLRLCSGDTCCCCGQALVFQDQESTGWVMRNVGWMDRRVLEWGGKKKFQGNVWCSLMSSSVATKQNCRCAISLTLEIQPIAEDANADRRKNNLPTSSFFTNAIWTVIMDTTVQYGLRLHFISEFALIQSWSMAVQTNHSNTAIIFTDLKTNGHS